jgi:hypothetical protein
VDPEGLSADQQSKLEQALRSAQAELADSRVEVVAGAGLLRIVMSGTQECVRVQLDPNLLRATEPEALEQLVCQSVNQAIQQSQLLAARRLAPLTAKPDR